MTSNKTKQVEHNFLHISKWFIKRCQNYTLIWLKGLMEDLINWCSTFNGQKQFVVYGSQNFFFFSIFKVCHTFTGARNYFFCGNLKDF